MEVSSKTDESTHIHLHHEHIYSREERKQNWTSCAHKQDISFPLRFSGFIKFGIIDNDKSE